MFTNGPRDRSSISGRVIPKTQKWYLMLDRVILCPQIREWHSLSDDIFVFCVVDFYEVFFLFSNIINFYTDLFDQFHRILTSTTNLGRGFSIKY